ncbi:EKC/KEOPS complex subunit TP53RK [Hylaeus anthracinus]|uniref:EKC/KEOPS complex subunit TP53RK n=1 Tax=Hylaeus volcanicus TaxID=313075 RepID=UPI0023B7BBCF|nr:EKC/KEOPS complex subunit TP53RK [Hylaeus volcanicus]XP_053971823.1 EKC/KEOPS complex subunit TP53RK [Hylaeus volcanicus]XP_053971824.1 EKC/KEOPS complex subunit TP53RK [Hylaeus volcanicus]XP_053971825.1 EKC/KEOPS complex subunit TP53RK [Hylaeus volcanicus]XP_053971826.1 EKC/KEOPS complex subunit TP53RK [Hylaeus volcanicus]XP_054012390.1 EKC/KEOPS complex subunit TP53RK [Hylaeus anthracinus]XP_054012391.1 EKC/KEOPS complex subunit TP53RK [Hylaeus anthracinus]XP_054012392.1 EKC/KEOPS compl
MHGFELIAQGAEARVYKGVYLGKPTLVKERFEKKYRHVDLDNRLTKDRIKAECRAIIRAKAAGVVTPAVYFVHLERRCIYMEYIENAVVLKDFIGKNVAKDVNIEHLSKFIARGLGVLIAKLHSKNIIHGDLTTSNILLQNVGEDVNIEKCDATNKFVVIDFGLARVESSVEDKAVDLYVLERSLLSAHSEIPLLFLEIFNTYQKHYINKIQCKEVVSKYKDVQARGRKRLMVG